MQQFLFDIPDAEREGFAKVATEKVAQILAARGVQGFPDADDRETEAVGRHVQELADQGMTKLGRILDDTQIADITKYLSGRPVYGGSTVWAHTDKVPTPLAEAKQAHSQAVHHIEDFMECPHLLETISSPFVLNLVGNYFGVIPTVSSPNLLWSFAGNKKGMAQNFHRDWDGFRHLVMFVYLTDVQKDSGAHEFIKRTHSYEYVSAKVEGQDSRENALQIEDLFCPYHDAPSLSLEQLNILFEGDAEVIEGPAGTAFIRNPFAFHRGIRPRIKDRCVIWTRFSGYHNGNAHNTSSEILEVDAYQNRLAWDVNHRYMFRTFLSSEFSSECLTSLAPLLFRGENLSVIKRCVRGLRTLKRRIT